MVCQPHERFIDFPTSRECSYRNVQREESSSTHGFSPRCRYCLPNLLAVKSARAPLTIQALTFAGLSCSSSSSINRLPYSTNVRVRFHSCRCRIAIGLCFGHFLAVKLFTHQFIFEFGFGTWLYCTRLTHILQGIFPMFSREKFLFLKKSCVLCLKSFGISMIEGQVVK